MQTAARAESTGVIRTIDAMIGELNERLAEMDTRLGPLGPRTCVECEGYDLLEGGVDALTELRERLRRPAGG